jgi:hypothetical protein
MLVNKKKIIFRVLLFIRDIIETGSDSTFIKKNIRRYVLYKALKGFSYANSEQYYWTEVPLCKWSENSSLRYLNR